MQSVKLSSALLSISGELRIYKSNEGYLYSLSMHKHALLTSVRFTFDSYLEVKKPRRPTFFKLGIYIFPRRH